MTARIGIDLGGTKIELRLVSGGSDYARRVATPRGDYDAMILAIRNLVNEVRHQIGNDFTVGVGIPGAVDREAGTVKNANSTWLIGRPLTADLEAALNVPVRVANDANCFALSEAFDGAAAGSDIVFGVILGTGVGAGLIASGRVIEGVNRIAGEWGHNPLPVGFLSETSDPGSADPRPCYCGKTGCIETYLSGPALVTESKARGGTARTVQEIADAAGRGDEDAAAIIDRFHERLAASLAGVINIIDPDIVVFGGGLSNLEDIAAEAAARVPAYIFSAGAQGLGTKFVPNKWGDSSGARGAAWLWEKSFRNGRNDR